MSHVEAAYNQFSVYEPTKFQGAPISKKVGVDAEVKKAKETDTVQISDEGRQLQEKVASSSKGVDVTTDGNGNYDIQFKNVAYAYRAVKNGFIDLGGKKLMLTDEMKESLREAADQAKNQMEKETWNATMEHNMKVLQQQAEALGQDADNTQRLSDIVRRIMMGDKISPQEEKYLSEYNPGLYSMAKQTALMSEKDNNGEIQSEEKSTSIQERRNNDTPWDSPLKHLQEHSIKIMSCEINKGFSGENIEITTGSSL